MSGIPLTNGQYVDLEAAVSNPNLRVLGQKDRTGVAAHFWVQNRGYTWWNTVQGADIAPQSGNVTISGLASGVFTVEEWDTWGGQVAARWQVSVDGTGNMVIPVERLQTDVAFKIYGDQVTRRPLYRACLPLALRSPSSCTGGVCLGQN
jgi:hypothetical protein